MRLALSILLFICFITSLHLKAQPAKQDDEDKSILYRNELSYGFTLHSAGIGLNVRRYYNKTVNLKRFYDVEFATLKHPKEYRSINIQYENSKSFIYGKVNSFFTLRTVYGRQHVISSKPQRNNVEVRLHYAGGISWGFTKPVYLTFYDQNNSTPGNKTYYTDRYDPMKTEHSLDNIYGRASFLLGFDKIKPHPGFCGKASVMFEYGSLDDDIKALEVGISIDAFPKQIPVMAYIENKSYFFNFYANISFGKKW
jgi:hypothetical protein